MTMLLAIDTSTRFISLALHDGRQLLAEITWQTVNYHTVELGMRVADMLAASGVTNAGALSGIAVALGPGTFTGLRAGLALAKGLALAGPAPLVGVPSLDITAAAQPRPTSVENARLCAVLSAGRGRLFAATYRWQGGRGSGARSDMEAPLSERWSPVTQPHIVTWDELLREPPGDPAIFCGEIDAAGAAAIKKLGKQARLVAGAFSLRRAGFLAELGAERLAHGAGDNPATLVPLYLHEPGSGSVPGSP
jgi:tRNA threonylcarbamoyladenosine biosynthesis protein TsaB